MEKRSYQIDAERAVLGALETARKSLLVLPTGTGKTVVFASVAKVYAKQGRRVLILAHTEQLLHQAVNKLQHYFTGYEIGMERAEQTVRKMKVLPPVVVASKDSLHKKRREGFARNAFDLIITDECHRANANTYKHIYEWFNSARLLGVTATPFRGDGQAVTEVFGQPSYLYTLKNAILDGYLVPLLIDQIDNAEIDLSSIRTVRGDLDEKELAEILTTEGALHATVIPLLERGGDRQTLVFCVNIEHAKQVHDLLNRYKHNSARYIHGGNSSAERERIYRDFKDGKFQYLCNCALLLEGYDEPAISCVAMARPTKSKTLYCQAIGRGTRLLGATMEDSELAGKTNLLIIDLVGNSGRHDLVTASDIIGVTDKQRQRIAEKLKKPGKPKDVLALIDEIEAEEKRLAELARNKRNAAGVTVKADYTARQIDPLGLLGNVPAPSLPGTWQSDTVSDTQAEFLERNKIDASGLDRGQAAQIIDRIMDRRNAGLCTHKQAQLLAKYGLPTELPFNLASAIITMIANNGWHFTNQLRATADRMLADAIQDEFA